jgi:hypothetical protein
MIYATNSPFHEKPDAFDGVRVNIPTHVVFLGVVNPVVEVALPTEGAVGLPYS